MRAYKPRRAPKGFLEGAPEYVLDIRDNGGETVDRYTVLFGGSLYDQAQFGQKVQALFMSGSPTHPQGVSIWDTVFASDRANLGKRIRWADLPENVRRHAIVRAEEED